MRTPLSAAFVALALVVVLAPVAADADTVAHLYPQLAAEMQNRLNTLTVPPLTREEKRQKAALTKASKPLAIETTDLATSLLRQRQVIAALDAAFKTDTTFAPMLDGMFPPAQFDVSERTAFLSARANALPTGPAKKKAAALIATAGRHFTAATDADSKRSRAARMASLSKTLAADAAGEKVVRKALLAAGVVVTQFEAVAGDRYLFAATGTGSNVSAEFNDATAGALLIRGTFQSQSGQVNLQLRIASPAVGDVPVTVAFDSILAGPMGALPATSGVVHFTTWDPENRKAAGTVDVVFANQASTITVTGATFSFIDMQTQ